MELRSTIRLVSDGTVEWVDLTFEIHPEDDLHVYFDGDRVEQGWTLMQESTPQRVVFDEPIPDGVDVIIRRASDLSEVPHVFHYTGNIKGGAEFNAKNMDENFAKILRASEDAMDSFELVGVNVEAAVDANLAADRAEAAAEDAEQSYQNTLAYDQQGEQWMLAAQAAAIDAEGSKDAASASEQAAKASEQAAASSESNAKDSELLAEGYAEDAASSESNALSYKQDAETARIQALNYRNDALSARDTAQQHQQSAEASKDAAATSASQANASAQSAESSKDLAYRWANEPEDQPVANGEFSAYHWAQKAQDFAGGDAYVLHQDLANPDMGAAMVARGVVAVDSIADLLALPAGQRKEGLRYLVKGYHAGSDVGGGEFIWAPTATEDGDGFSVINPYSTGGTGRFIRIIRGDVTPEMAGAIGDGVADDGPALRAVVGYLNDIGGGVLRCQGGAVYSCSVASFGTSRPSVIRPISGVSIYLNGATIQTNDTVTSFNYNIIEWFDSVNCTVEGGTLKGNKHLEGASYGEWGIGIGLYGAVNCHAKNLRIVEQGGDGLYIGRHGAALAYSENCSFENIVCDDNRRQGISLISGKNLTFRNIVCSNTSGTSPQDGIDIEPNNTDEFLQNIVFENIETFGNSGEGLKFYMGAMNGTSNLVSVTFINFKSSGGDRTGLRFRRAADIGGSITFKGSTELINPRVNCLAYEDFESIGVVFDELKCVTDGTQSGAPINIGAVNDAVTRGAELLDIKALDIRGVFDRGLYFQGTNQPFIRNINIHVRHIDTPEENNAEIGIGSGEFSRINITADIDDFYKSHSAAGQALRSYSPYRHPINHLIRSTSSTGYNIEELRVGASITVYNDNAGAVHLAYVGFSADPGDRFFSPGGAVGQKIILRGRGAWVRIRRMVDDTNEYRIEDGLNYEFEELVTP